MDFQGNRNPMRHFAGYMPPRFFTELRVGTGRIIPTVFTPPNPDDTPQALFSHCPKVTLTDRVHRFIRCNNGRSDEHEFLIYTDASCMDNGRMHAKAGCSFVYNDSASGWRHFALEYKGPSGQQNTITNDRAHIRAVLAALRYRDWTADGFRRLIIATDSEYVVDGITDLIYEWLQYCWITRAEEPVRNRDLWEFLVGEIEMWEERGLIVQFWWILKELNRSAHRHARTATFMESASV
ncbi:unnamed protein product [Penicillium glandicola]